MEMFYEAVYLFWNKAVFHKCIDIKEENVKIHDINSCPCIYSDG